MLTVFQPGDRRRNSSLLFLVEGTADIGGLRNLTAAFDGIGPELRWSTVANHLELGTVDPALDATRVTRFEVAEFEGLGVEPLRELFAPAVEQLQRAEPVQFPSAARAEGCVARGADFLGREEELQRLDERLRAGAHLLLVAPRRSGKTSLLCRLAEVLDGSRYELVDAERFRSCDAFTGELWARATGRPFTAALKEVRQGGWTHFLPRALEMLSAERRLVLMIDELVFFMQNVGKGAQVCDFLERLSEGVTRAKAVLVVAGSLELERVAKDQLGIELPGILGRLEPFALPPLAEGKLDLLLRRVLLGTGLVLEAGDAEWLRENVDLAMPYPALRFLSGLASAARERSLGTDELERELSAFLGSSAFAETESHLNRLAEEDAVQAERVERVLDLLAAHQVLPVSEAKAALAPRPEAQAKRLGWMAEHFPLKVKEERVELASRLFRRFWITRGAQR